MNYLYQKLNSSIFLRVIVTFLAMMIPIYAIGVYIYNWGVRTVRDEIFKSTTAQVSFYLQQLEGEIERLKILQYDCLNDEYLNKLAIRHSIMDNYETVESMRQLQLRLITIANSSMYVKNVSAHIPPIGKTISASHGLDDLDLERFAHVRAPSGSTGAQLVHYDGSLFLSTLQQQNASGRNQLFAIEIELNPDVFVRALEQFNTYPDSGSYLFGPTEDVQLASSSVGKKIAPQELIADYWEMDNSGMTLCKVGGDRYYSVYARSPYLNMLLLRYIPERLALTPLQNFKIWAWTLSAASLVVVICYSLSVYRLIHKPMVKLVNSFRKVENGDLQVAIDTDYSNEFGYLYTRFNEMVRNLEMLIDQVYKQKILMQRAELKHLQSQINPHFLYNSFFMINTMARIGDENLILLTKYLGEYFRFVTRNAQDYVTLQEEVDHARTYTDIQSMRFSKSLTVQFEPCPQEFAASHVPRLIIQPVVENAFQHSAEKRISGSVIAISFETREELLHIIVEDNGSDMSEEKLVKLQAMLAADDRPQLETTGLLNIHRRIRLVYNHRSGIRVERSHLGGLRAILMLEIRKGGFSSTAY